MSAELVVHTEESRRWPARTIRPRRSPKTPPLHGTLTADIPRARPQARGGWWPRQHPDGRPGGAAGHRGSHTRGFAARRIDTAWCGQRQGETMELRRQDRNLSRGALAVSRAVTRVAGADPIVADLRSLKPSSRLWRLPGPEDQEGPGRRVPSHMLASPDINSRSCRVEHLAGVQSRLLVGGGSAQCPNHDLLDSCHPLLSVTSGLMS